MSFDLMLSKINFNLHILFFSKKKIGCSSDTLIIQIEFDAARAMNYSMYMYTDFHGINEDFTAS